MKNIFITRIIEKINKGEGNKIAFKYIENNNIINEISYLELINKIKQLLINKSISPSKTLSTLLVSTFVLRSLTNE